MRSAKQLPRARGAILMVDPVKTKPLDTLLRPLVRPGVEGCGVRYFAVETRVEDGYLRNGAQCLLGQADLLEFHPIVQWRDRRHLFDRTLDSSVDLDRL